MYVSQPDDSKISDIGPLLKFACFSFFLCWNLFLSSVLLCLRWVGSCVFIRTGQSELPCQVDLAVPFPWVALERLLYRSFMNFMG